MPSFPCEPLAVVCCIYYSEYANANTLLLRCILCSHAFRFYPVSQVVLVAEEQGVGKAQVVSALQGVETQTRSSVGAAAPFQLRDKGIGLSQEEAAHVLKHQVLGLSFFPGASGTAGFRKDLTNSFTLSPGFHFTSLAVRGV